MKESIVMTVIARDRPGLVEALAAVIADHGGNWEESRMIQLAGEFAGLLRIEVEANRAAALEQALGNLADVSVAMARGVNDHPAVEDARLLELEVVGQDHPGIVHRLAAALAARQINVEELESELFSAPMSGEKLFRASARLRAPRTVGPEELRRSLEQLAADLMVDLTLEDPDDV